MRLLKYLAGPTVSKTFYMEWNGYYLIVVVGTVSNFTPQAAQFVSYFCFKDLDFTVNICRLVHAERYRHTHGTSLVSGRK